MSVGIIALLKVLGVLAAMLLGMRAKLGVGWSILAGGLLLALLFGLSPLEWARILAASVSTVDCLALAAVVTLVLMLSFWLERTRQTLRLMEAMSGFLRNPGVRLTFFPLLIGLLPMPGGAVFSAPMVKSAGDTMAIEAADQALVNYWYRHVWELCWPLYPGIILAAGLSGIPLATFIFHTGLGTLVCFGLGWLFILRPLAPRLRKAGLQPPPEAPRHAGKALLLGLPLMVAIVGSFGLETLIGQTLPDVPVELGIIVALLAALTVTARQNGVGRELLLASLKQKELWQTLILVGAVFTMSAVMDQAQVVRQLVSLGGNAALLMAAVFAPALVGMVAGITMAFVGATFPLMLGLVSELGLSHQLMAWVVLAFVSGYAGVMASPLHICFAMTCDYFHVDPAHIWRRIMPPCLGLMAFGAASFLILRG